MARSTVQYDGANFDYVGGTVGTFPGAVSSVFGRTGAVTAQSGDYTAAQVGALASNAAAGGALAGTFPNPSFNAATRAPDWRALSVFGAVVAESIPRPLINNNGALLTSARLSSQAIPVFAGNVVTNVAFLSATTALSAPANVWFALCDSSFNVIRQSTDQLSGAAWAANSVLSLAADSLPVTAGSRSGTTTVTLTFPTLSEALTSLIAVSDSVVVSNANIAAYNGTFTVTAVTSTTVQYTAGSSASDSLSAPFPTVRLAAGKRTYTVASDGYLYAVVMVKGTVPTLGCFSGLSGATGVSPVLVSSGNTGLTGTCPSPITHGTGSSLVPACAVT